MAEEQEGTTVLSDRSIQELASTVERLSRSDLYRARLRRAFVNGHDPKVLTDFLVLDDVILSSRCVDLSPDFWERRSEDFAKALESARRRLDVRIHDQLRELHFHLHDRRKVGETADLVLDTVAAQMRKRWQQA